MLEARQRLDMRQIQLAEDIPCCPHGHQAWAHASPAARIGGIDDTVEDDRVDGKYSEVL